MCHENFFFYWINLFFKDQGLVNRKILVTGTRTGEGTPVSVPVSVQTTSPSSLADNRRGGPNVVMSTRRTPPS